MTDEAKMEAFFKTLTTRLEEEIVKAGLSYYQLARNAGIARVTISNFLNGKRGLGLTVLLKICLALDVKPETLFKGVR